MASFHFDAFEGRRPPPPLAWSAGRELAWQGLAIVALVLGAHYLHWRWTASLNPDALWFAITLAAAETLAYAGLLLFTFNLWFDRAPVLPQPPRTVGETSGDQGAWGARPIAVDIFITTYDEDEELVRLSVRDALRVGYPWPISVTVHVLDDGRRPAMERMAGEEGARYISRATNEGYKAGNLRHAMEQTSGDFIVIADADTRLFPSFLAHTLGYFRDPDVAWVQTPQWFYDIPPGVRLPQWLGRRLGAAGAALGRGLEHIVGPVRIGRDPFGNDAQMFYDVIQRRRNWCHASFCCGAGSVHRREAVMQAALRSFALAIDAEASRYERQVPDAGLRADLGQALRTQAALARELTPYRFHVSEDIYTSIVLHSDPVRPWKSVLHPWVESRMLSPQDLLSWMIQRYKYAGGTLDIAFHDNPLLRRGGMSAAQRLMYLSTIWSYLGCLWNVVFLAAPVITLATGIAPLAAYASDFHLRIVPFVVCTELAFLVGTWGVRQWDGKAGYMAFFPLNFRALWAVLRHERIRFHVTPKVRQQGNHLRLVLPQLLVVALTLGALAIAGARVLAAPAAQHLSSLVVNAAWALHNVGMMLPIILAALWEPAPAAGEA